MSNKQETIADIVREMRNLGRLDEKSTDKIPRSLQALGLRTYSDRIEAAMKKPVTDCNQLDNSAKMREALERIASMGEQIDHQLGSSEETVYAFRHERCLAHNISECARSVLAAPPRNCDMYTTLDDARNAFFADYASDETCSSATAFAIWLYDEAKLGVK